MLEPIKNEYNDEITFELILVKNETDRNDCSLCIIANSKIYKCHKCRPKTYFILRELID